MSMTSRVDASRHCIATRRDASTVLVAIPFHIVSFLKCQVIVSRLEDYEGTLHFVNPKPIKLEKRLDAILTMLTWSYAFPQRPG